MIDLKYMKIAKSLVKKSSPLERFRFIHQNGNQFIATNGFHFLLMTETSSNSVDQNIIDVHKIYSGEFDAKLEIGVTFSREEKEITAINFTTVQEQEFEAIDVSQNMQELVTIATIEINKETEELWYLDMIEYYGVMKSLEAMKVDWTCSISKIKKSIKFTASKDGIDFEYYLILRTVDHQPS